MGEEGIVSADAFICNHLKEKTYAERFFDILNGFELTFTSCINCHKIVSLEAKKFSNQ